MRDQPEKYLTYLDGAVDTADVVGVAVKAAVRLEMLKAKFDQDDALYHEYQQRLSITLAEGRDPGKPTRGDTA